MVVGVYIEDIGDMKDMLDNIGDYFPHMIFTNLVAKIDFELGVSKVSKVMVYSNYFGGIVDKLEIIEYGLV